MTHLDTRVERAKQREPITTLGDMPAFQALSQRLTPPSVPAFKAILASREAKSRTEPDRPLPLPERAPRKRDGEPAASFSSDHTRITLDGQTWQVEVNRDLTSKETSLLQMSGFDPVDDQARVWNATQKQVREAGGDVNRIAFELSGKAEKGFGR